jgi:nucleoside-diphosphate-sugar epimerase
MVHGKPIDFTIDSSYTRKLLNWSPQYDLGEGLVKTIEWFKECQKKYIYG